MCQNCLIAKDVQKLYLSMFTLLWIVGLGCMFGICLVEMLLDHATKQMNGGPKKFLLFVPVPAFYQLH